MVHAGIGPSLSEARRAPCDLKDQYLATSEAADRGDAGRFGSFISAQMARPSGVAMPLPDSSPGQGARERRSLTG